MKEIDKYMTVAEAAERWAVKQETIKNKLKPSVVGQESIDRMIKEGLIKYFQKPGGQRKEWIISIYAMERWFGKMKKIYENVELDYTNMYPEADEPVIVVADVEVEIDSESGEKTVVGATAKEKNKVFGVEAGEWFDPENSISVEDLEG